MHSQDAAWCFCHRIGKVKKHLTYGIEIKQKKPPSIDTNLQCPNQAAQESAEREQEAALDWTPAELGCRGAKFKWCLLWQYNFKYFIF